MNPKIKNKSQLKYILGHLKSRRKRIVFTNGCFELIHIGHIRYLAKAKALGDILIVAVNSDSSVHRIKGRTRPIIPAIERIEVISSIGCVDYTILFNEETPEALIKYLKPDILVKGADYKLRDIAGKDIVKSYGGKVKAIPLVKGKSTTGLIKKICQTCIE